MEKKIIRQGNFTSVISVSKRNPLKVQEKFTIKDGNKTEDKFINLVKCNVCFPNAQTYRTEIQAKSRRIAIVKLDASPVLYSVREEMITLFVFLFVP